MSQTSAFGNISCVAAVLLICGAAPPPPADLSTVVAELFPPPEKVVSLARQARSRDRITRDKAVDELVPLLRQGMTRKQVETLLGPPNEEETKSAEQSVYVTYDCRSWKYPRQVWWRIAYDAKKEPHRFLHSWRDSPLNSPVEDDE